MFYESAEQIWQAAKYHSKQQAQWSPSIWLLPIRQIKVFNLPRTSKHYARYAERVCLISILLIQPRTEPTEPTVNYKLLIHKFNLSLKHLLKLVGIFEPAKSAAPYGQRMTRRRTTVITPLQCCKFLICFKLLLLLIYLNGAEILKF